MSNNVSLKDFVFKRLYLPVNVCNDIKKYLLISLSISILFEICFISLYSKSLIAGPMFFTMLLILMPICLYIGYSLKRVANNIKSKNKTKVKYWLFSKYIVHLIVIILLYFWLSVVLLSALLILLV